MSAYSHVAQEYIGADKLGRDVGFLKEGFEMMEARPATRDVFTRVEEGVERIAAEIKRRTTDEKEICYSEVNDHMHPHNVRGALEAHDEKFHKAWKKKKECEKVYKYIRPCWLSPPSSHSWRSLLTRALKRRWLMSSPIIVPKLRLAL